MEVWDAGDFHPWETLQWPTAGVPCYRQHKMNGTVEPADWLTGFPVARLGTRTLFRFVKGCWEIENQVFNERKNFYGMEHIQRHHPNSLLANWLFVLWAIAISRLFRTRSLHRSAHPPLTAMPFRRLLWLYLQPAAPGAS